MMIPNRKFVPLVIAALILVAGTAAPGLSYKGIDGHFNATGGTFSGGAYKTVGVLGVNTHGPSSSAGYINQEGVLAFFGRPFFEADASALDFGLVATGNSRTMWATVKNYGGVGLLLGNLRLAHVGADTVFTIESPAADTVVAPGDSVSVGLRFAPTAGTAYYDTLRMSTNDPTDSSWAIFLSGTGQEETAPIFVITADSIVFGGVPIDSSMTKQYTISNYGNADLVVMQSTPADSVFSIDPQSFTLPPDSDQVVLVRFTPAETRSYRDTVHVSHNAAEQDEWDLLLTGAASAEMALVEPADRALGFDASEDGPSPAAQMVRIANEGAETLHWSGSNGGLAWILVEPDTGSVAPGDTATINVSVDHMGLASATYEGTVSLQNDDRPSADRDSVAITLVVKPFAVAVVGANMTDQGESVQVRALASAPLDSGRIHYRKGGETAFHSLAMSLQTDTSAEASIPGAMFDIRGVEYFVRVYSGGSSVTEPNSAIRGPRRVFVHMFDAPSPSTAPREHRMFGVPLQTDNPSLPDVFVDDLGEQAADLWRLGRWSQAAGGYLEYPNDIGATIGAGNGFWLITKDAASFLLDGLSVFPSGGDSLYSIYLSGGEGNAWWTQIGHPFAYEVNWSDCYVRNTKGEVYPVGAQPEGAFLENAIYDYVYGDSGGAYVEAGVLEPWRGYFVNNISGEGIELLIPARESSAAKKGDGRPALLAEEGEWELRLSARSRALGTSEIIAGMRGGARSGWDGFDRFEPPPPPGGRRGLSIVPAGAMPAEGGLRADIREVSSELCEWRFEVPLPEGAETRLSLASGRLPGQISALLVDDVGGAAIPVGDQMEYRIVPRPAEKSRTLRLVAGPMVRLSAAGYEPIVPVSRFELGRPYPNPALHGTSVRYAIPEGGEVRLRVYGLSGRLVRELAGGPEVAGEHIAVWDGRDERGRDVGTGIYFLRLAHRGEVKTARVVVFR